ncbi:tRNA methyltransferase 10 homolog A isoform X2 [Agrilus planipennis]|uniref:tRNA (guanine(9)-N(1))-methyltransferase n=1 Tax=Agrilus planipennis TaxID=224129 RepID=A0A1W4X8B7_AGRPL|nr:tRNA methyltransferase 10 homolog A isoform X2 [Agrilus planipennis]
METNPISLTDKINKLGSDDCHNQVICEEKTFNGVEITKLSKSQMKKYQKMLRWQARKADKRAKEREKLRKRKIEAKINNISLGPSRKELKRKKMIDSNCKISVVIDLSFDDLMIPKDLAKLIKQVLRVYTENRRATNPMQLYVTNFNGKSKTEMEKHNGYENWDINFCEESYINIFPIENLIYLTSESDNIIEKLDHNKVYVIGGLVDHNAHKGLCYRKAVKEGIAHGQLPISNFFSIKYRKVFTINQE